ncbi:hypothetical protein ZOSMA_81G01160 [Zostera marina]|uniref:Photosystem II reaction center X protein n=1 Tax=Zostera marina TaxID=29655 RepID=A0A0K9NMA6_ZOSMR|nr:hypothetical protein ZOSMA_81G01160 [Zostera marina]
MASTSAVSMVSTPITAARCMSLKPASSSAFFNPLPRTIKLQSSSVSSKRLSSTITVQASSSSMKEKAITGLTAAAVVAALVVPEMAEAAQPGVSPSLKNLILSVVSGGVVLIGILGAIIGVSNFDPVKRG